MKKGEVRSLVRLRALYSLLCFDSDGLGGRKDICHLNSPFHYSPNITGWNGWLWFTRKKDHLTEILVIQQQQDLSNSHFCRTTQVGQYQKDRPFWIFQSRDDWVAVASVGQYALCKSVAPCPRQITVSAPHHLSFLWARCSSCHLTSNNIKWVHLSFLLNSPADHSYHYWFVCILMLVIKTTIYE